MTFDFSLIVPAFIAGLLTFAAPCTVPLIPGFISFITGASLKNKEPKFTIRLHALQNAWMYVFGFSLVFIALGSLVYALGSSLVPYRIWIARLGGILIIIFGLVVMDIKQFSWLRFLYAEKKFHVAHMLTPGRPSSAFLLGATLALGWTPCIGPILGSALLLTATQTTFISGLVILISFSLGLGLPFLILAWFIGHAIGATTWLKKNQQILSLLSGGLLVVLGILIVSDSFGIFTKLFFEVFPFLVFENVS